jgi:hypothetical protein
MKRIASVLFCSIMLLLPVLPAFALDYAEASQGLGSPQWEGGRSEIEMADLNLDGNIDLIAIGDHGNPFINTQEHGIMFYAGDGLGRWTVTQVGNFGYGGIAVGDANNDGLPDVGYGMHHNYSSTDLGDQLIEVALGDGSGISWTPWDDNLATAGEDYGMFATDFGDVNNDGLLDIAATSFGYGNPLHIYLNDGDGTWTHASAPATGNCGMHIVFGDINKDGNLDLATAYQNGTVYFGDGTGQFTLADYNLPPGSGSYNRNGVALGDVDNDGGMDLAWVSSSAPHVWAFNESLNSWVDYTGNLPTTGVNGYAQLWDMNGDGFCDLAVGGSGVVTVWTGNGQGQWAQAATYTIQGAPTAPFNAFRVGGDADHNGFPDMVHLDSEGSFNPVNHLRFYRETTVPQNLTITPLFPRGGEVFKPGSVRFTDWLSAVPGAAASIVKIELSTSGATGPWATLADSLPNNGRLQWTVPTGVGSSNCYMRYTVFSGSNSVTAVTPNAFTIFTGQPDIQVTLTPVNPPIVVPAQGGSFSFTAAVVNNGPAQIPFWVWAVIRYPDGTQTAPVLGPVSINPPVGITISRLRTQNIPGTFPPGLYNYVGFAALTYPGTILDSSYFAFTKSSFSNNSPAVWDETCSGEPFPGEEISTAKLSEYVLCKASPNPFNPITTISYDLSSASFVALKVYDTTGRLVTTLVDEWKLEGWHQVEFDGTNLAAGLYCYRLASGQYTVSGKLVLLK